MAARCRTQVDERGGIKNGSIVRWRYLSARKASRQEWEEYLAEFWAAHRDAVLARHIMLYPGTRPLRWWQYDTPEACLLARPNTSICVGTTC